MKVLVENIGNKISDISCSNIFASICPKAREIKEKVNKLDYINYHQNEKGTQCAVGGNADWCSHCEKQYGVSSNK